MHARYDDVLMAVKNKEWDRAIRLIEDLRLENKNLLIYRMNTDAFALQPTEELAFEKTTDFLPFHGWEAA